MSGSPNAGTPSSPAPNRPTHSSAAFLHHLHTDPTSHHITLSATGSRLGSGASKSPASAPFPLQAVDLENVQTAAAPLKLPDKPPITPPSRSEPVAGPSSLKAIGRIPSRGERPKTAPVIPGEGALPRIEPSPESSAKMQSRRSSEDRYLMEEPLEDLAHPPNHDEILALHEAGPLVVTGDACIATFMTEESGASEAGDLMPMSAGDSRLFLLGRGGSLRSPEVQPGPMESPPVEQTSWKTFSKAYSQGMFDPNKIPNPPRATMSPLDPPSARSSPGRHYSSMPPAQSDATSRSGSRAFSSASGSSGATTSTQASSAPPTSAANTNPSVVRGQSSINLSLAARRKAREVENRPSIPIRPDHLSIPSYTLAAATVRMATRLRDADFAPLGMPSPERELMDPMASVMPGATATRKDPSSDPGSSRLHLSRSMSSAIDALSNLPTIQGSPVSTPSEHSPKSIAKPLPELNPRRTSPQRSRGGIVNNRIAPASAPIERTIETENTTDYFGSAPPHFARRTSFTSQSSSSRTTVQGTPMPPIPTGGADSPPVSPDFDAEPPRIALPQDIGALYERFGWLPAPLPPNEAARRRALYRFNILHTTSDPNFDRIAHMAKLVFSSKIVMIALIDNETQWHKAQSGMDSDQGARISSFCSHSVLSRSDEPFVILDALQDWRFANNPQVVGPPHIRFYAGAPLRTSDGHNIGTLCIMDDKPRSEFPPRSRLILKEFAAVTMREMELWRDKLQLRVRDKIQISMEKFTRECLEMDASSASSNAEAAAKMDHVYARAAQLVNSTLDLDGCFILDIGQFEMMEMDTATGSKTIYRADPYVSDTQSPVFERSDSFGPVNPLPVLAKTSAHVPSRPLLAAEHEKLSEFLCENRDGRIFENTAPSWIRYMFPSSLRYGMVVPAFRVDQQPFALICAYTSNKAKQYLEGYELQFLRAIGVIILSAVLRRRMLLADKAKSILISSVSHELRTPLHGILAAAELLADTELDANQVSFLKTVQTCGSSLIETVDHVLDFTKLSGSTRGQGGSTIRLARVNLANLVEQTVEACWIGQRARFFHGDSDIGSFYAPPASSGLPPKGQRAAIGQELLHVETVIDIAQREKDGYIQVTIRELPHSAGSKTIPIEMAVIDTGKGISKGFLKEQLFQPFSQENPLQTGTGLGLAIVNSIVRSDNVNGKVDVWSSEGMGTEIRVSFDAEVIDEEEDSSSASSVTSTTSSLGRGLSLTLLAFDVGHRGHMLSLEVLGAYAAAWHFELKEEGDILVINEDEAVLERISNVHRPIIFLITQRIPEVTSVRDSINQVGGSCQLLYKPIGPHAFRKALQSATDWMTEQTGGRPSLSRGDSGVSQESLESNSTVSELSHRRFARPALDSRLPLTRRRSEEKEQQASRPVMAPRGVTYHVSRRVTPDEEPVSQVSPNLSSPTSSISTISLADGGVMLKAAAVPPEAPRRDRVARIMVVEDNVINRRVLGAFLKKKGIEYAEAVDGQAGVNLFESALPNHWDIILMDISMPVMNGHEATRAIRKIEASRRNRLSGVPATPSPGKSVQFPIRIPSPRDVQARAKIFALTGLATADDMREAFRSGVDGYLVKPVSLASLDAIFKKIGF